MEDWLFDNLGWIVSIFVLLIMVFIIFASYSSIQAENERHAWCVNLDNIDDPRYGYFCDDDSMEVE